MKPHRRALLSDPLDALSAPKRAMPAKRVAPPRMAKYPLRVPVRLLDAARNVAYWDRIGVSELAELALAREIERREKQRGEPYPRREHEHRPGRKAR